MCFMFLLLFFRILYLLLNLPQVMYGYYMEKKENYVLYL